MLFKLSLKNIKKSMRDYMVYFATLILGVAIFYVFNALEKQTVMMNVSSSTKQIVQLMNDAMSVISVFVAVVLGFLIVYASNFLIKRRKKEFGIYMLLGMTKRKISYILLIETILIGGVSLVAGLVLGVFASQAMSVVVANMFEADMTAFTFVLSQSAIMKTVIYFIIMYLLVLMMNAFIVGRTKLINLIHAGRKAEKNTVKNPFVCTLVFVVAVVILGSAYYNMTVGVKEISETQQLVLEIIKGIISTFLIFWSLSGILLFVAKKCRRFYYKGLNDFTIKELGSRVNTTVFSGSVICLMLFMTICILSSAMSVRKSMNDNLQEMIPMDDTILYAIALSEKYSLEDVLKKTNVDMSMFRDELYWNSYNTKDRDFTMEDTAGEYIQSMDVSDDIKEFYLEKQEEIIKIGDYNRIAQAFGIPQYSLEEDEYMIVADYDSMMEVRNGSLKDNTIISIGGKDYKPKYEECQEGFILMASSHINMGVILVPDNADLSDFVPSCYYFVANYHADNEQEYKKIEEYIASDSFANQICPKNKKWAEIDGSTKESLYDSTVGLTAMIVFIGVYLGIVFMISGAAILALKELSEAADNKEKYMVLRKIGVDEKEISKSLFAQCGMFFGIPLIIAGVHSIFGIQVCVYILETVGTTGLLYSILMTAAMIVAIYGVYFMITFICSKNIIKE